MKSLTVSPAYGIDYKSAKALLAAFAEGKDFKIESVFSRWCGSYVNKEILQEGGNPEGWTHIEFSYGKMQKVIFKSFEELRKLK